jgi:signal transduction histidine kinase
VQKHAAAARAEVTLTRLDGIAELTVRDDGRGFDPTEPALTGSGVGLSGMRERAELVGGSLTIASSPGKGCAIRLTVPLTRRRAPEEGTRGTYPSLVG